MKKIKSVVFTLLSVSVMASAVSFTACGDNVGDLNAGEQVASE